MPATFRSWPPPPATARSSCLRFPPSTHGRGRSTTSSTRPSDGRWTFCKSTPPSCIAGRAKTTEAGVTGGGLRSSQAPDLFGGLRLGRRRLDDAGGEICRRDDLQHLEVVRAGD